MLSLDNAYNEDELRAFDERVRKGAGLGDAAGRVRRRAEDRRPEHRADLRGRRAGARRDARRRRARRRRDAERPDDPGDSAAPAAARPRAASRCAARCILPRAAFERMNREREEAGEPLFANPRNAAAGTMRNLDPALVAKRGLSAFTYQIVGRASAGRRGDGAADGGHACRDADARCARGGCRSNRTGARCDGIDEVVAFCQRVGREAPDARLRHRRRRHQGRRPGAARTARHDREVSALGDRVQVSGASRRPRRCEEIAVNVGRTGAVTPYAVLEPVFLAGSTISMATLHNAEDIARKDLREGDRVLIEKGGDVIPKVVKPILPLDGADAQRALADADRRARCAAARCSATRRKSSGGATTRRARRACAAASSTSRRARR